MSNIRNIMSWVLLVLITFLFQFALIFMDFKDNPTKVAIDFSKAYFLLDSEMTKYISENNFNCSNEEIINNYLLYVDNKACNLGFNKSAMKRDLKNIKTKTKYFSKNSVEVKLFANGKTYFNSLFSWVGSLFHLGKSYEISETIMLVKEGSSWKISSLPYELSVFNSVIK